MQTIIKSTCLFSHYVESYSLQPHGQQHAGLPHSSLLPGVCSSSCPLSQWYPSNDLILCHPFLLLPSIFPSIRVLSNELALHIRWSKYWSFGFGFSISLSNEYSGLISIRIDWFDPLAVQGTLKSLLQHHNSKASILQRSAFFNFMAAVTVCSDFGTQENKICHCSHFFPLYLPWSDGAGFPS